MTMTHTVVSAFEWAKRRAELQQEEKELNDRREELLAKVRAFPWTKVVKSYTFQTVDGTKTLADLFEGRSQLVMYHFMMGPGWKAGCHGCSFWADHFDSLRHHLPHAGVTFKVVSRAPLHEILAYKARMGWEFDWVSAAGTDFNKDFGSLLENDEDTAATTVFTLEGGEVYQTYYTGPATETRALTAQILNLVPSGKGDCEVDGVIKRHDEY